MRGCAVSPTCISRPLTLPMSHSSRSISFLSRTSRTRFTSASHDLEWNRYHRENEGYQHNNRHDRIADPAVAVLTEVDGVVHEQQKRNYGERQRGTGECHRHHRHLDRIDAENQRNRRQENDDGVDESESRVLRGLEVFAPVPAEALCEEVRNCQRNLERRAKARENHRKGEQIESPPR